MSARTIIPTVATLAVVALSTVAVAPAGAAVTNVRITAGTTTSGTANFQLSSSAVTFVFLSTPKNGTCAGSTLAGGVATLGTHSNPAASIAGSSVTTSFRYCVVNFGANAPFTISGGATSNQPWRFQADYPSSNPSGGSNPLPPSDPGIGQDTVGTLYNINFTVSFQTCSFPVTGFLQGVSYQNTKSASSMTFPAKTLSTSHLVIGTITLLNGASTCLANTIHSGDKISLATTYTISATNATPNPIWLNAG